MKNSGRSFLKGVAAIASGTAAAQLIQVSVSPIITRLYEPAHVGGAGAALALVGMLLPLATLGFSSSIVVVGSQREALLAYGVSQKVTALVGGGVLIAALFVALFSPRIADHQGGWGVLLLIPVILLVSATRETRNFFLSRLKLFGMISKLSVAQAAIYSVLRVLGGVFIPSISALLISYVIALVVQSRLSLRLLKESCGPQTFVPLKWSRAEAEESIAFAREHKDYVLYRAPQAFVSAMAQGMPILFVTSFIGLHEGGLVALAKTITSAPVMLVGQAVSVVALSHFSSRLNDGGSIYRDQVRTTLALAGLGLLPVLVLAALGPPLFAWVFGEPWREAGEVAAALSPLLLFQIISRPSVSAIQPLGLIRWHFKFEILSTIVKATALYVGCLHNGFIGAIRAFSVTSSVAYLIIMVVALKTSKARIVAKDGGSE